MLERELKKEQAANKNINNNSNTFGNRNNQAQKNVQPTSEYP